MGRRGLWAALAITAAATLTAILGGMIFTRSVEEARRAEIAIAVDRNARYIADLAQAMERKAADLATAGASLLRLKRKLPKHDFGPDFEALLTQSFETFPEALGGGIWYEPNVFEPNRVYYGPYAFREGDGPVHPTWDLSTPEYGYLHLDWYTVALPPTWDRSQHRERAFYWSAPYRDAIIAPLMITVDAFIHDDDGRIAGISTVDWALNAMLALIAGARPTARSDSFLIDATSSQVLSFTPEPSRVMRPVQTLPWLAELASAATPQPLQRRVDLGGGHHLATVVRTGNGMVYGSLTPEADINRDSQRILLVALIGGVALTALFLALYLTVTRRLQRIIDDRTAQYRATSAQAQNLVAKVEQRTAELEKALAEQLEAEAHLSESEQRFRILFESSVDPVWIIDQHQFVECNQAAVNMLGYPDKTSLLNAHPSQLSPAVQPDGESSFVKAERMMGIAQEKGLHRFEWEHKRFDDSTFLAEVTLSPMTLQGRQVLYCVWRDITERKHAEETILKAKTELEAANLRLVEVDKLKSNFLSSVSHELRTPLTSIRGFASLIEREFTRSFAPLAGDNAKLGKKAARIQENTGIILKESERLTRLINDVLDLAKIESGRQNWNDAPLQVADLLRDAANAVQGMFDHKPGVSLRIEVAEELPRVVADADKLQQVLVNLLNNAAKFTEQGNVTASACLNTEGMIQVEVRDTGSGFPPEDAEKIFEKFQQSAQGDTLTDKPKGTGLGLSIAREIVEHYGGRVWASSVLGQGSVFAFTLPPQQNGVVVRPV